MKSGLGILIRAPEVPFLVPPNPQNGVILAKYPQKASSGTQIGPRKVIFGHFAFFLFFFAIFQATRAIFFKCNPPHQNQFFWGQTFFPGFLMYRPSWIRSILSIGPFFILGRRPIVHCLALHCLHHYARTSALHSVKLCYVVLSPPLCTLQGIIMNCMFLHYCLHHYYYIVQAVLCMYCPALHTMAKRYLPSSRSVVGQISAFLSEECHLTQPRSVKHF